MLAERKANHCNLKLGQRDFQKKENVNNKYTLCIWRKYVALCDWISFHLGQNSKFVFVSVFFGQCFVTSE